MIEVELGHYQRYAEHVRENKVASGHRIHPTVFHQLSRHRGSAPLLPNLRILACECGDDPALQPVLFITPTLLRVTIKGLSTAHAAQDDRLATFVDALAIHALSLEYCAIGGGPMHPKLLTPMRRMQRLRSLKLTQCTFLPPPRLMAANEPVALRIWQLLADIESLSSLDIDVDNFRSIPAAALNCPKACAKLKSFRLVGNLETSMNIIMMYALPASELSSLALYFQVSQVEKHRQLFSVIPSRFPHLRKLELAAYPAHSWSTGECSGFSDTRGLEEVDFTLADIITGLDDQELDELTHHWRKLTSFSLYYRTSSQHKRVPTLRWLAAFVRNCPNLIHLQLPICTRIVPWDLLEASKHRLKTIKLLECPAEVINTSQVARALESLFPELDVHRRGESWTPKQWREVFQTMQKLRAAQIAIRKL
ncbi:hypothetical protein GLOTRDRAFT_130952 [Gloeophyllum trabeum ATCC 11539]|uniref:RNI-like protein n=1 Tax=Gloeophyllum trabeum (strain ATCC 11539 / FP-39264 / Madison 617) TaxID=670483 RepID=S7Q248_GLOTA|nr:uncharacterized protein GLOTRDRAFT_130952 [Gloeophyllum trabeum ATCC 11539]EPQ53607.1 hypothetical protein GLOTRDRAFT_130952 [Gloeophyllum trabeum ATCC 11539]